MGRIVRIISGGQSGADRAGVDAAVRHGIPYAGWCPRGGFAEDRSDLLEAYPGLRGTPTSDPAERTRWNVRDASAVLIIRPPGHHSPGTDMTLAEAQLLTRPLLVTVSAAEAHEWLETLDGDVVLDIAGPRESQAPGIYDLATLLLDELLD